MLIPTLIYAREMQVLLATGDVLAAAHITGGGLYGNLSRVIPEGLSPRFTFDWKVPPIFARIQSSASVSDEEMRKVFNLGIGIALVARKGREDRLIDAAGAAGFELLRIGTLADG
jgi:phosphoribosylformylglycinamidine cyclo-ligase